MRRDRFKSVFSSLKILTTYFRNFFRGGNRGIISICTRAAAFDGAPRSGPSRGSVGFGAVRFRFGVAVSGKASRTRAPSPLLPAGLFSFRPYKYCLARGRPSHTLFPSFHHVSVALSCPFLLLAPPGNMVLTSPSCQSYLEISSSAVTAVLAVLLTNRILLTRGSDRLPSLLAYSFFKIPSLFVAVPSGHLHFPTLQYVEELPRRVLINDAEIEISSSNIPTTE
jgi:hypothetical protein